jgi:hypothetical protein
MSAIQMSFNAATVAPNAMPEPVPSGTYPVVIIASEEKPVSGKPGHAYYQLDMQITDGEYKGRKVVERLNVKNANQQTVDIAYSTLSSICHVTGVMQIGQSSAELHNRPFKVVVVKVPRTDDPTKEGNEIRGYLDMAGNPPGKKTEGGGTADSAQAAAFGATETAAAPAAPAAPSAPAAPAAPDPKAAAIADGWQVHPQNPAYMYKGSDVVIEADVLAKYTVPNASAAAPATPPAPAVPETPATNGASAAAADPAIPSWAQ